MPKKPLVFNSIENKTYIVFQLIVSFFMIGLYFFKSPVLNDEISEFGTVITSKPRRVTSGEGHKSIDFKITDCTNEVRIDNEALEAFREKSRFLNETSVGDSVFISINNWDYKNLILQKNGRTPSTGNFLEVVTLKTGKTDFLILPEYNHYKKKDEILGLIFGIGLFFLVAFTVIKKITLASFLEKNWWLFLILIALLMIYSRYGLKLEL